MPDQPKLCECGCGEPAPIAKMTRRGYAKGEPMRFLRGHVSRVFTEETRRKMSETRTGRKLSSEHRASISAAKKGKPLPAETIRKAADARRGKSHSPETRRKLSIAHGGTGEMGYGQIHHWLTRDHPKTGVCEECGRVGKTHYAFKHHPQPHTRERADYRELCPSCHKRFDAPPG